MELDLLLYRYFGTNDFGAITPAVFDAGRDRLTFDFADEKDPGRRFALWTLMFVFEIAPSPEEAFETEDERRAARMFIDAAAAQGDDDDDD
jgi:hypothetical protein